MENSESKEVIFEMLDTLPYPLSIKEAKTLRYNFVNKAFTELFGISKNSVFGCTSQEIFEKSIAERFYELDQKLIETKKGIKDKFTIQIGSRKELIEIYKIPHFAKDTNEIDLIIDTFCKLNQETTADEILRETEIFFQNIFERLPVGVIVIRATDFSIIQVNPYFANLFNLEIDQILYKTIWSLEICKDREVLQKYLNLAKEYGYLQQLEEKCKLKDGREIDVALHIVYVEYLNQEPWYLFIVSDLSVIQQANREIISLIQKEQELQQLKNRFISLISHELRTPLSAIVLSVDLLQRFSDKLSKEEKDKHFEKIRTSVQTIIRMIENSMHLEKLTTEEFILQPTKISLKSYIKDIAEKVESIYNFKNPIRLHINEEFEVETDEVLLGLILNNLIGNAIKYSNFESPVNIYAKLLQNDFQIQIQNFGEPIPKEEIPRLFNIFFRGKNSSHTKGYGIGLSIVKKAVEALQGSIEVESSQEKGTIFTVKLPRRILNQ
ncbi:MAG: Two-component system sensor histidine kinase [Candidatus Kapaibacterium sp.]|nr:MAG: Two-component system sensor histidine kinase [Candidatus Kapabacteria bacterium]